MDNRLDFHFAHVAHFMGKSPAPFFVDTIDLNTVDLANFAHGLHLCAGLFAAAKDPDFRRLGPGHDARCHAAGGPGANLT